MKNLHVAALMTFLIAIGGCGKDDDSSDRTSLGVIPNPALIVANGGAGLVQIINPATGTVVATAPVDDEFYPHHLSISHDGAHVLMTATGTDLSGGHGGGHGGGAAGSRVYRIDTATGEFTKVLSLDATVHNAAFLGESDDFALCQAEHGMVHVYDGNSLEQVWSAAVGSMPLEATSTHDGNLIVVANSGDASVSVVDVAARAVSRTVPVGQTPVAAWLSVDGSFHVSNEDGGTLSMLNGALSEVSATIDVMGVPGQAFETPDGSELWVAIENRGVVGIYDAATHTLHHEISVGAKPHGIAFNTSGSVAYVTNETSGKVHVIDVATRQVLSDLTVGGKPNGVVFLDR